MYIHLKVLMKAEQELKLFSLFLSFGSCWLNCQNFSIIISTHLSDSPILVNSDVINRKCFHVRYTKTSSYMHCSVESFDLLDCKTKIISFDQTTYFLSLVTFLEILLMYNLWINLVVSYGLIYKEYCKTYWATRIINISVILKTACSWHKRKFWIFFDGWLKIIYRKFNLQTNLSQSLLVFDYPAELKLSKVKLIFIFLF